MFLGKLDTGGQLRALLKKKGVNTEDHRTHVLWMPQFSEQNASILMSIEAITFPFISQNIPIGQNTFPIIRIIFQIFPCHNFGSKDWTSYPHYPPNHLYLPYPTTTWQMPQALDLAEEAQHKDAQDKILEVSSSPQGFHWGKVCRSSSRITTGIFEVV